MKRKVVQHGPTTLTISLPARWVKDRGINKGDDITVEEAHNGLFISTSRTRHKECKRVSVKNLKRIITKVISALYKSGYDEIIIEYSTPEELEQIHDSISKGYIGFEIVDETKKEVHVKKVSEPQEEEFKTLFRRIFYFLISTAEETLEAAKHNNTFSHQKLVLRDENINKLSDFCRRIVNTRQQTDYYNNTALYHLIEQLEKIGDHYKGLNRRLAKQQTVISKWSLSALELLNVLLADFESLFFNFKIEKVEEFVIKYDNTKKRIADIMISLPKDELPMIFIMDGCVTELYNLIGVTMMLHL